MPDTFSIPEIFGGLTYLPDRTPETPDDVSNDAFAEVAGYRDGAIFVAHYAGNSAWERHPEGDEIVAVLEGKTTVFLLEDGRESPYTLNQGELVIVPVGVWHRFETPDGVKILTVTPQPTDHSLEKPVVS